MAVKIALQEQSVGNRAPHRDCRRGAFKKFFIFLRYFTSFAGIPDERPFKFLCGKEIP